MGGQKLDLIQDQAFMLRSIHYKDHHRIISCLTRMHGRVDLLVYSAFKSQKRGFGILDFTHALVLDFKLPRQGSLGQLIQCQLLKTYPKLCQDYQKIFVALNWFKNLSRIIPEGGEVPGLFELLEDSLGQLERHSSESCEFNFFRNLLTRLGYHLTLGNCVQCQSQKKDEYQFCLELGGLLCSQCRNKNGKSFFMSPFTDALPQNLEVSQKKSLQDIFCQTYREYLGIELQFSG